MKQQNEPNKYEVKVILKEIYLLSIEANNKREAGVKAEQLISSLDSEQLTEYHNDSGMDSEVNGDPHWNIL